MADPGADDQRREQTDASGRQQTGDLPLRPAEQPRRPSKASVSPNCSRTMPDESGD
jgi:hypothetical protein